MGGAIVYDVDVDYRGQGSSRQALQERSILSFTSQASESHTSSLGHPTHSLIMYVCVCSIGRPKHVRVMAGGLEGDVFIGPKAEVCNSII